MKKEKKRKCRNCKTKIIGCMSWVTSPKGTFCDDRCEKDFIDPNTGKN